MDRCLGPGEGPTHLEYTAAAVNTQHMYVPTPEDHTESHRAWVALQVLWEAAWTTR